MNISEKEKIKLIQLIRAIVPGITIILFGSHARQTATQSSDIDLAVDAGRPLTMAEYTEITGVLDGTNLPCSFDIVDLHKASAAMKESIEKDGIRWTI
jgi:predicted nucleotidyltransferase